MSRLTVHALAGALLVLVAAAPALACQAAGPNTHMGVVTAVNPAQRTFTLKDAESGKPITFAATPEQLAGLKVKDEVSVVYAAEGATLRARSITKG